MTVRAWEMFPKEGEWDSRVADKQTSSFLEISAKEDTIQMRYGNSSFQTPDRGQGWYVILKVQFSQSTESPTMEMPERGEDWLRRRGGPTGLFAFTHIA